MDRKIDKLFVYAGLTLVILFAILTFAGAGCVNGKVGANDNPVAITTTMPVTLYTKADLDAAVKAAIVDYEQKNSQSVNAGGDVNQFNFSLAGGGAAIFAIIVGILGIKYINALKAFKTVADVIEQKGHPFKRLVEFHAGETGMEKYINKKVKRWYK